MKKAIVSPASLGGLALYEYVPNAGLSRETTAFSGIVYDTVAGKPVGTLTNEGHGGCHFFHGNTPEDQKRWNEACRNFTPIPWASGEHAGCGEWELDEALALLSETVLALMNDCGESETKSFAADPRAVMESETITIVTTELRPGKISATARHRLATDSHEEFGTIVFGEPSMSKPGGVNVFMTEAVDVDGERFTEGSVEVAGVR